MLSKLTRYLIFALLFLTPIFYWTITPNFFTTAKEVILLLSATILLIIYAFRIIKTKSISLPSGGLALPILTFLAAMILNIIFSPEGRPESLASKGFMLITLPLIALLILTQKNHAKLAKTATLAILSSSLVLAIHSLLQLTFLHSMPTLPLFMQSTSFTLTGSFLTTLTLLIIGAGSAIAELKHNNFNKQLLYSILLLNTVSSVAIISLMFPGGSLTLNMIPYIETWSISLDALKSIRSLFFGVGLPNFPLLYTSVKPLSLNMTPLWNTLPQSGSSELLTMLATTGITGAVTLAYLMLQGLLNNYIRPLTIPLVLSIVALILTPGSLPIYLIFFVLLALNYHKEPKTILVSPTLSKVIGVIMTLIVLALAAYQAKAYIAERYMRQAQLAMTESDGKVVYEDHLKALKYNPKITNYHLSLADVNLNIASALSQKKDLTDADRTNISTLVQQSIKEAKTAISLRPNYASGWITLAKIYRNLIGIADGSDQFAIQSYSQAVALDPANPSLRIEYGGLFYQLATAQKKPVDRNAQLSRAVQEFQLAIKLKKDYANAYYNLAKSLELAENYSEAVIAMQQVVAFTDPASPDYQKAVSELETMKAKVPKNTPVPTPTSVEEQTSELQTPSPLPSPISGGPIEFTEQ